MNETPDEPPHVSVVVPAYNPGPYLRVALDSLTDQTYPAWDAVVVDDGSTEDLSWVDSFDARVRRLRQPNAGLSRARNAGIRVSTGELVAFLDADDFWLPPKLERQVEALADPDIALVSTGFTVVDGLGADVSGGFVGYADSYDELLQGNGICASTVVVRRSVLERCGDFDPALRQGEDWDLWLRISRSHTIVKLPETLARYRVHGSNMTRDYLTMRLYSRRVLHRHLDECRSAGDARREELIHVGLRRLDRHVAAQAFELARAGYAARSPRMVRHLAWAVRLAPRFVLEQVGAKWPRRRSSRSPGR
jgi:glycosyltransferase involved in cell wall biosynthesis